MRGGYAICVAMIVLQCGRPWVEDNCRMCGAIIGGKGHKEATGNQAIEAGDR